MYVQAILALLRRSLGSVVRAIFGWATLALFGEVREKERTLLSVVIGAAAAWPLLVVGVVFPRQAAFALTLLPVPKGTPEELMRFVWIALTLVIPLAVGWALSRGAPKRSRDKRLRRLLLGFPATVGIGLAFLVACAAIPVRKLSALARGRREEHVPLAIPSEDYEETAGALGQALGRGGLAVAVAPAPWATRVLGEILNAFTGPVLGEYVAEKILYFRSPTLELTVYPNGARILGTEKAAARAHALISESATATEALQCMSPEGQKLERRIKALAKDHGGSPGVDAQVSALAAALAGTALDYEDWQILYRELLQVVVASRGASRLLESSVREERTAPGSSGRRRTARAPAAAGTGAVTPARDASRPGGRSRAGSP